MMAETQILGQKRLAATVFLGLLLAGCAGNPVGSEAEQCRAGLKVAYQELDTAKAEGLEAGLAYTKAAALLGAAKVQEEFGKYPNCIIKVKRARQYIQQAMKSNQKE